MSEGKAREMQWPWSGKSETEQWLPKVHEILRRFMAVVILSAFIAGVLRGNTIRGNTTRNPERKMALWEGLWEGHWKTSENL